ncbi:MAG: sulfite exporter TauE/SafE family protein [Asgard group archaeon]|nr:sulfite exporter TauE/SafE family protein [Asgard group archaeon]
MEPLTLFFILVPIGLAVGIFAAITGLGGGVLMVPILTYGIFLITQPAIGDLTKYATTISSAVIIFTGISATVAYSIQKRIDYLIGIISSIFSVSGAILGKWIQFASGEIFVIVFFAVLLFATAVRMFVKVISTRIKKNHENSNTEIQNSQPELIEKEEPIVKDSDKKPSIWDRLTLNRNTVDKYGKTWEYKARLYLTPLGFLGGFVAGMAGVGGGIVMVPILHLFVGLPMHFSTATSAIIMIFSSLSSVATAYANTGIVTEGIWWPYVIGLAIGIIVGAQIGALIAKRIKADPLKVIFAAVLLAMSIWTVVKAFLPSSESTESISIILNLLKG